MAARIRVLESLARLEREALDRRRLELAAIERRLDGLRGELEALRAERPVGLAAGWELPGGPAPAGRWLATTFECERALRRAIETAGEERSRAIAALEAQLAARKQKERLLERARAEREARIAERERRELDELATLRHGRPIDPAV